MACTWLKPKRKAQGLTQEKLAEALGEYEEAIRRWENCKPDARKDVPYVKLAGLLEVSAAQLCEEHLRDLEAAGLEHAAEARKALVSLPRARYFPPVDPAPIEAALEACTATGLVRAIGERMKVSEPAQQAARIAKWLGEGNWGALSPMVDTPLDDAIDASEGQGQLQALWKLLRVVMRSASAADPAVAEGGYFQRSGEDKAWVYRLHIDNANQLDGMRVVALNSENRKYSLDDSPKSTLSVQFRELTQTSVEGRVHELVKEIALRLSFETSPPPIAQVAKFEAYCKELSDALSSNNNSATHVFALCGPDSLETDEVKTRLRNLLGDLRLFDCADPSGESSVSRVDSGKLEKWYTLRLHRLSARGLKVDPTPEPDQSTDKPIPKENTMPNTGPQNVFNINMQNGDRNNSAQAGGDAQIAQQTTTALPDQVADLLEQVLGATNDRKQETKDLRHAMLEAQNDLKDDGSVTAGTKQLLQRAFDALPKSDALIKTGNNLLTLIDKLSGAGS